MFTNRALLALLVLFAGCFAPCAQAETFHTCGTIINSIPTVITTQGVYCLSHDVATTITTGNAISINTNNVTLDCNGYKIGGLAAGTSSLANGIYADNTRQNITVRNCGIRGFYYGINLQGGAGHLVEDNRLDNNLLVGIQILGDNNRVQRNRIYDTGGTPFNSSSYGMYVLADVIDNTVSGVFSIATDSYIEGIDMAGPGTEARGNQVRGLLPTGVGKADGISVYASGVTLDRNRVSATASTAGFGIYGFAGTDTFCMGNTVAKFTTSITSCQLGSDNLAN